MIARIAISPAALAALGVNAGSPADSFGQHAALCEALEAHGHLVFASEDEGRLLVRSIKEVGERSPEAGKLWARLFNHLGQSQRFDHLAPPNQQGLDGAAGIDDLRTGWSAQTDVAALQDAHAEAMGVGATQMCRLDPPSGIDVARIGAAAFAGTLADLKNHRDGGVIKCGESRELLWDHVLQPLARVSRHLTVVDRYLFSALNDAIYADRGTDTFVGWLLAHLDADARDACEVTLIGFRGRPGDDPADGAAAANLVSRVFEPTGRRLSKVDVLVTQPASYLPHDRHISSNVGVGVTFPASFDVFARDRVSKAEGVEFVYRWNRAAVDKLHEAERRFGDDRSAECVTAHAR